jgi:Xaa-Pro dipeptidase
LQAFDVNLVISNAEELIASCRRIKSSAEIALLTQAKAISLRVQQAAAKILRPGIDTREVQSFIDKAHIA